MLTPLLMKNSIILPEKFHLCNIYVSNMAKIEDFFLNGEVPQSVMGHPVKCSTSTSNAAMHLV